MIPGPGKIPWKRERQPSPVFLPGGGRWSSQTLLRVWPPNQKKENFPVTQWLSTVVLKKKKKKNNHHGSATFREIVHFTEVALLDLTYSADLHYLETYLFPIVLDSMSVVESHLLFQ